APERRGSFSNAATGARGHSSGATGTNMVSDLVVSDFVVSDFVVSDFASPVGCAANGRTIGIRGPPPAGATPCVAGAAPSVDSLAAIAPGRGRGIGMRSSVPSFGVVVGAVGAFAMRA